MKKNKIVKIGRGNRVEVVVSDEHKKLLEQLASKYNCSIAEVLRAFIEGYLISGKNNNFR